MERPRRTLTLTDQQRAELEWARDRHPKPYLRERAAALLKIAGGQSPHAVALGGLLKPRHPQRRLRLAQPLPVRRQALRPARLPPGFFPLRTTRPRPPRPWRGSAPGRRTRRAKGSRTAPAGRWRCCGGTARAWRGSRPTPARGAACAGGRSATSAAGVTCRSPDARYAEKVAALASAVAEARARPAEVALLYADEKTVHRQPAAADAWGERGRGGAHQPRATLSHRSNTKLRLAGALDAVGGRVVSLARSKAGVREMCELLRQARAAYPSHGRVVVAWDNWPIHSHPKVLAAAAEHRVELLFLPTYAPWTNPIEKLWGWLQRDVLTMHRLADQWDSLKQRVLEFLARFDGPSPDLLRMVGLN